MGKTKLLKVSLLSKLGTLIDDFLGEKKTLKY